MKAVFWMMLALLLAPGAAGGAETLNRFDQQVRQWALDCRSQIIAQFDLLLTSGQLSTPQLFDTFYIPIPNTDPQKFRTQYDNLSDGVVQPIIDQVLKLDERLVFVVIVDRNGYLPTHNSRFSQPLTGNASEDAKSNRTKRIFNDRTGLAAARNLQPYLLQRYSRDTGEVMSDLSVPIFIQNRHWGALRIGYQQQ
jgi:methyl-accepting chemotaxis protein